MTALLVLALLAAIRFVLEAVVILAVGLPLPSSHRHVVAARHRRHLRGHERESGAVAVECVTTSRIKAGIK